MILGVPVRMALGQVTLPSPHFGEPALSRNGHNFRKPRPDPFVDCGYIHTERAAGGKTARIVYPVNRDRVARPLIVGAVLSDGHPSAVAGLVTLMWVSAVNGMPKRWPLTHISKKRNERSFPAITDLDPTRTVASEIFKIGIGATALHPNPYTVGWASLSAAFMAVNKSFGHVNWIPDARRKSKAQLTKIKGLLL